MHVTKWTQLDSKTVENTAGVNFEGGEMHMILLQGKNSLKLIKCLWKFGIVMECCRSFWENLTCNTLGVGISSPEKTEKREESPKH